MHRIALFLFFSGAIALAGNSWASECTESILKVSNAKTSQAAYKKTSLSEEELATIAKRLQIYFLGKELELRKVLLQKGYDEKQGFAKTSRDGYWKFRIKEPASILRKMKRAIGEGKIIQNIEDAKKVVIDGIGARLVLDHPDQETMSLFVDEIIELIESDEIRVEEIENYRGKGGLPYLTSEQMNKIIEASQKNGFKSKAIKMGEFAEKESGYTSLHINIILPSGARAEIQVRGLLIEQLSEVSHVYYDFISGKGLSPHIEDNVAIRSALEDFKSMSEEEKKAYGRYLSEVYYYIRLLVNNESNRSSSLTTQLNNIIGTNRPNAPEIPDFLKKYKGIGIQHLADSLDFRLLRDVMLGEKVDRQSSTYKFFDSVKHIINTQSPEVQEIVLGNVSQGSARRVREEDIYEEKKLLLQQLNGLQFIDVISWEEHKLLKQRRDTIRAGLKWPSEIEIPEYDEQQPMDISEIAISELSFMQDAAKNKSGEYSIIGNGHGLKNGKLDISVFPPLKIWRDKSGKYWSLDHRRLAAFILSGVLDEVPVQIATKEEVYEDRFKLTNADGGKSMIMHLPENSLAYIVIIPQ